MSEDLYINGLKIKNTTIILVSHNLSSFKYCDKVYEIKKGSIIKK